MMVGDQDPGVFSTHVHQLRDELAHMGVIIADAGHLTGIGKEGITDDYINMRTNGDKNPDFSIEEIASTMRNIYTNQVARGLSARTPCGRESAMMAASPVESKSTRYHAKLFTCDKLGYYMFDRRSSKQFDGSGEQTKWWSIQMTDLHDTE